jgi:transketolase
MSKSDNLVINTIRILSAEAIQKANSGHPGLPMGSAPMAYTLWSKHMQHNPKNPEWANRDRFVLSAGHGSMLVYTLLHLFGYGLKMDDLKQFRQWESKTPGHPEYGHTTGIETTTGPLGQGVANAVGMAIAEANLSAKFNTAAHKVVDHYTYTITGDGCLMEGISAEASSLAGHLKLGKLIVMYDKNNITIEGDTDMAFTEDVGKRYEAYGWQVLKVEDGNTDLNSIDKAIAAAKAETNKPTMIIVRTKIGYGCPPLQGSHSCHGAPLGEENIDAMKEFLGWEYKDAFFVPDEVKSEIKKLNEENSAKEQEWNTLFEDYKKANPALAKEWDVYFSDSVNCDLLGDDKFWSFENKPIATRISSEILINRLADRFPNLIGGSADLGPSNKSVMKDREYLSSENYGGSNIHYGVREFAMASIANGIALHGGLITYVATFFVFSDYMKHSIRLSALMGLPVMYVFTHDSIGVGEDGPTHEPIEHLAAIRSMPGVYMFRPADSKETAAAYTFAINAKAPTCLALTRQNLPLYEETGQDALKGGYILKDSDDVKVILIGTGSEVELCVNAYEELKAKGIGARVVSMPCTELFDEQPDAYKEIVLPSAIAARVVVEAGTSFGWGKYVGLKGEYVTIDHFGASAPADILFKEFGFTTENLVKKALKAIK